MEEALNEKRAAKRAQLYEKSVKELVDLILYLEDELEKAKVWRSKLIKIRNIVTPQDQKRRQGRPGKDEGDII